MIVESFNIVSSKDEWTRVINNMPHSDFYFSYDYHLLSNQSPNKFVLLHFKYDVYDIALPLIIRPIPDTSYFDATSVYGYSGPLSSHEDIPNIVSCRLNMYIKDYLEKNKIISVFSRLHPVFQNEKYFKDLGEVVSLSQTVFIDLKKEQSIQIKNYRKGVKSDLSKLKKDGYEVVEDSKLLFLDNFIEIYKENMKRVNASEHYIFSKDYFSYFLSSKDIGARLFFVRKENNLIAGSIFTFVNGIIQYHLSGTNSEFLKNSPIRLLLDHVRQLGSDLNYSILHLGGGVGSSRDSLFDFKAGFSKSRLDFKVWKYIVNQRVYDDLVSKNHILGTSSYFPLYRASDKQL